MTDSLISPLELGQRLNKPPVLSSRQLGWNGILVEQCQCSSPSSFEMELPAISAHWLNLSLGRPAALIQKRDDRLHESIIQKGDSIFVPAGQPSYWRQHEGDICCPMHICLKPELIEQVAEASEIDTKRINLVNCFGKQDLQLHHIAMLLLAELQSGAIIGRLYVESLTQVLVIHLLRHYSQSAQIITSENRRLTHAQLQQVIDYIHTYLNRDLSLAELADVINISPTYFANLFKQATGISPHQYVIRQRVERAKVMLTKTDLAIADIALQVGFSSQSHLTQHFKRFTGMTPKQIR
ncbi:helix-turn-helix transcriptional regulator [Cyanobacteria bacterium FACHB-471]|nr:helix-turn-helix transcriptional regulator [Cyanobacteria bacterium FACHB-471]